MYLRQHAGNPVDWYPWGQDAFAEAVARDCPVFLSIGYSACHWCHVMAHESFESDEIAAQLNRGFVCVKVDREERPDVDAVYMDAVQSITGQGGWPLSVFLTPDGAPFFGGTYFPPSPRHGSPGFTEVLDAVRHAWDARRSQVVDQANRLRQSLQGTPAGHSRAGLVTEDLATAARAILAAEDRVYGGFGSAPKFPQAPVLRFLVARSARHGDLAAGRAATGSLAGMAAGGIHDQLAGGFHRYSVDAMWTVPHFEKMLYDNALLARTYLEGWQLTGGERFAQVAVTTAKYIVRDLRGEHGGFLAGSDADTDGQEGRTFVWTPDEIRAALHDDDLAATALSWYGVTPGGNCDGATVLTARRTPTDAAAGAGLPLGDFERALPAARAALLRARATRAQPTVDDKVHTAWNGLAIDALARVGAALHQPALLEAALGAARFVQNEVKVAGSLAHMWARGVPRVPGFLEDFASLAGAAITLFEVTGHAAWQGLATDLAAEMLDRFGGQPGALARTGVDHDALIVQSRELADGAEPSGNALAIDALLRLHALGGDSRLEERARAILADGRSLALRAPMAVGALLAAGDDAIAGVRQVSLVSPDGDPPAELETALRRRLVPGAVVIREIGSRPAAVVCHHQTCGPPVTDVDALFRELGLPTLEAALFAAPLADPAWP